MKGYYIFIISSLIVEDCVIPAYRKYRATIKDNDGALLSESSVVRSGETIDFECRHGYIPGKLLLMCDAQRWNTSDDDLPLCTEGTLKEIISQNNLYLVSLSSKRMFLKTN